MHARNKKNGEKLLLIIIIYLRNKRPKNTYPQIKIKNSLSEKIRRRWGNTL